MFGVVMYGLLLNGLLGGCFYVIFLYNLFVVMFGLVFGFVVLVFGVGVMCFWCDVLMGMVSLFVVVEVVKYVFVLIYFDGGYGDGCNELDDVFMCVWCWFYYFMFYGFMLCFVVMFVVIFYYYVLDLYVLYVFLSLFVLFGIVGGIGLLIGFVGFLWFNLWCDFVWIDLV